MSQLFGWILNGPNVLASQGRIRRWTLGLACLLLLSLQALATHNRAGEITYSHVEGLTYEILITTYTKQSAIADRPWLFLYWGDEQDEPIDSLERETIVDITVDDLRINTYRGTHTYGGPGIYDITVIDPNRNDGVLNIEGSVDVPFSISSTLYINPLAGHNNSVQLLNSAQQNACLNQPWIHNPGAFDPDGDVLTYSLTTCSGYEGQPIPGYLYPQDVSPLDDLFEIDAQTGDLTWDVPVVAGEYNVAILIEEHRWVDEAGWVKVGQVVRDMQINVQVCDNQPPVIAEVADTCVLAGTGLTLIFNAEDPDDDPLDMTAVGGPISEVENVGFFNDLGSGMASFVWSPQCEEVRSEPYTLVVKARDLGNQVALEDIETVSIRVIAPAPEWATAEPVGNAVLLDWFVHPCLDDLPEWQVSAGQYRIYRRVGEDSFDAMHCETDVQENWGYEMIAELTGLTTNSYVDTDLLSFGATYCYRIVAEWPNSGPSKASDPICTIIRKDVPVMTQASVNITDIAGGETLVGWSPPTDADTLVFPGPYHYRLYEVEATGNRTFLTETDEGPYLNSPDTTFVHTDINTLTTGHDYLVESWSAAGLMGESTLASTPYLVLTPDDNRLELGIDGDFPWIIDSLHVYRLEAGAWDLIAQVEGEEYVDFGLVNNVEYCYQVETFGHYDAPGTTHPLRNWSQETCGRPFDLTPPCPPDFTLNADCLTERNVLSWSHPEGCADDVMGVQIFWAPFADDTLSLYAEITGEDLTSYEFNADNQERTIAGCFAVAAFDSLQPGPNGELTRNLSSWSDTLCADNCPFYFLPNVFSPNADGQNDRFEPFPWKFVDSVDVQIFNRTGGLVFQTQNPNIEWDGQHWEGGMCADGVYFYAARVYTRRLSGIVEERLQGEIHLFDGRVIGGN
ncbi:MAG: gliding motility-associated C-terminal domain-containing protein [Flavobacteriales bacterium]